MANRARVKIQAPGNPRVESALHIYAFHLRGCVRMRELISLTSSIAVDSRN